MDYKKITVIALIISFLAMQGSALEEIATQNIGYGEYIKQYAIVEFVTEQGMSYRQYCGDCTAYITIKDDFKTVVNETEMVNLSLGLYGYKATTWLNFNQTYDVIVYTESPTYGNGSVYSRVTIDNRGEEITPSVGVISSKDSPLNFIGDGLEKFQDSIDSSVESITNNKITLSAGNYLENIFGIAGANEIYGDVSALIGAVKGYFSVVISLLDGLKDLFIQVAAWQLRFFNEDSRASAIEDAIVYYKDLGVSVFKVFLPVILVFEIFVLAKTVKYRGAKKLDEIIKLNIRAFEKVLNITTHIYNMLYSIVKITVDLLVGFANAVIPW